MGATISYNGATIETIEDGHSGTIPKTAKPQTNVEILFSNKGAITYSGKTKEIAKGKLARLLCKDKLLATDVLVAVEMAADPLNPTGIIPEGATYKIYSTGVTLTAGNEFPKTANNDVYTFEEYAYTFYVNHYTIGTGWNAKFVGNKAKPAPVLESINAWPITGMSNTYQDCSLLEIAPSIPNTVKTIYAIFSNCKKLKTYEAAPTNTADGDFSGFAIPNGVTGMANSFAHCEKIVTPPAIPASVTDMYSAFYYCTSLKAAPDMTNAVGVEALNNAFAGCSALIVAPNLSNCLKLKTMNSMFSKCTSMTTYFGAPTGAVSGDFSGFVIPPNVTTMQSCFKGLTQIVSAPAIPAKVSMLNNAFEECTGLITAPDMSNAKEVWNMGYAFAGCRALETAPDLSNCTKLQDVSYAFGTTAITIAPVLPANVTTMTGVFTQCFDIKSYQGSTAPDGDFSGYVIPSRVKLMNRAFYYCGKMTKAPDMNGCGELQNMKEAFQMCYSLVVPPNLNNCNKITNMATAFRGCAALTTAPVIPASVTDVTETFSGCTALTGSITINATPTSYTNCLRYTKITEILGNCGNKEAILATK
jgi:hypothetical protein